MKKNLFLADISEERVGYFIEELKKEITGIWICKCVSIGSKQISFFSKLSRLFKFFLVPFTILVSSSQYAYIVCWQQFFGLNLAFWMRLFHKRKQSKIVVMTFIYKKKKGFIGKVYDRYMHYIVSSAYIDKFVVYSSSEVTYYSQLFSVPTDKFLFVPFGIDIDVERFRLEPDEDKYIFGTGRSNRDWDFLHDSLFETDYKAKIACDVYTPAVSFPNVKVLNDCFGDEMRKMMAQSYCIVVPLKDQHISSGQLVILYAMALGKPIIATKAKGVEDYLLDGETAILIENTRESLLNALDQLYHDDALYQRMSNSERITYTENYTLQGFGRRLALAIKTCL